MSSFEERLSTAVQRGHTRSSDREKAERSKRLSEEELKNLHTKYRLQFSEHIEVCVRNLPDHFPGFQVETLFGDRGWGQLAVGMISVRVLMAVELRFTVG